MEARYVQMHLQRCGVVVHLASPMPSTANGQRTVVVFLEGGLQQFELARRCALKLPEVRDVSFSGHTGTIMYVTGDEPHSSSPPDRRPAEPITAKRAPGPVPSPGSARRRTTRRQRS